jgi:long-chain acyl-CoA synthetase
MVIGENVKFASALVSPNFNYLHFFANKHKIHYRDNAKLIQQKQIIHRIQQEINEVNKQLGEHEKIKRFRLVCEEWSPQTGELSPTLKLKRKVILNKYSSIVNEIYGHPLQKASKEKPSTTTGKFSNGLGKLIPKSRTHSHNENNE